MALFDNDIECVKRVLKPCRPVLDADLEELKFEDEDERLVMWERVRTAWNKHLEECSDRVDSTINLDTRGQIKLSQLKLATSFYETNKHYTTITKRFSPKEYNIVIDFEKYKQFDVLSEGDIVAKAERKEGGIYSLVKDYYNKQYSNLDAILDDHEIKKDVMVGIKRVYESRQKKIKGAVSKLLEKHGPTFFVEDIEKSVMERVKESEEQRERVAREMQDRVKELEGRLRGYEDLDRENDRLKDRLSDLEGALHRKDAERSSLEGKLNEVEEEKNRLLDQYNTYIQSWNSQSAEIEKRRRELEDRERELNRAMEDYRRNMEEENQRIMENELAKVDRLKNDLAEKESAIEEEKRKVENQRQDVDDRLRQIREALEGGEPKRFVTPANAKLLEMNFITRFEMKVHEEGGGITSPVDGKTYKIKSWEDAHHKSTSTDRMYEKLKGSLGYEEVESRYPLNTRSRYVARDKKFLGLGEGDVKVVLEAFSLNHLDTYARHDFDTRPVTLSELMSVLTRFVNTAEMGRYFHVIGIASPTGWDDRVKEKVYSRDFGRDYVSRFVSLCLIDPETGELIYNSGDERIKPFIKFYEPHFDTEKVEKVKGVIKGKLELEDYVVLEDIVKESGEEVTIVKKALYALEEEGYGKVKYISDVGLVLGRL